MERKASAVVFETQGLVHTITSHFTPSEMLVFGSLCTAFWEVSNAAEFWTSPDVFDKSWLSSDAMATKRLQVRSAMKTRVSWPSSAGKKEEKPSDSEFLCTCPHKLGCKGGTKRELHLLMDRIKKLSMMELRKALVGVDTSHCVEKPDYQKVLQAFLLFGIKPMTERDLRVTRKGITYPDWALNINEAKATYFHATREAQRTELYKSELLKCEWAFWFKLAQDDQGRLHDVEMLSRTTDFEIQKHKVVFFDNGTMTSSIHSNELHYSIQAEGCDSNPFMHQIMTIQVENYPPLHCYRQTNGVWTLENQNVVLEGSPLEELPLL